MKTFYHTYKLPIPPDVKECHHMSQDYLDDTTMSDICDRDIPKFLTSLLNSGCFVLISMSEMNSRTVKVAEHTMTRNILRMRTM